MATPVIGVTTAYEAPAIGVATACESSGVHSVQDIRALYYIGVGKAARRATAMDMAPDGLQVRYASAQ